MQLVLSEQSKILAGALHTVALNGGYTQTQVPMKGRNTSNVTATIRPLLDNNCPAHFHSDDFEGAEAGVVNLAVSPRKRTFKIGNKRLSALRLADDDHLAGEIEICRTIGQSIKLVKPMRIEMRIKFSSFSGFFI